MRKKRVLWIVLVLLVLIISVGLFVAYQQYQQYRAIKQLDVSLLRVTFEEVKLTSVRLRVELSISNPNTIDVSVGKFNATVFANSIPIALLSSEKLVLPAQESLEKQVSVELDYLDVGVVLLRALKDKQVTWSVKGEYVLELPFGMTYPYHFELVHQSIPR